MSVRSLQFRRLSLLALFAGLVFDVASAAEPVIDCRKPPAGSVERLLCEDAELKALDRTLAGVYTAALAKSANEHPPFLKAEQRGWIKGRNDCWKSIEVRACVVESYHRRVVELQARYRLVGASAPVRYVCNGNPADEVIATYFETDPPTLIAERGDQTSLMFQERSASGTRYVGRNELLWEHQGQATIRWGYDAPEMACVKAGIDAGAAAPPLSGTSWRLRTVESMDDAQGTTRLADTSSYTVRFGGDGRATFALDCNRASAPWTVVAADAQSGSLRFGPIAMTRARCPAGSLDQKVAGLLSDVRSYLLKDGQLHMSLFADGGLLHWEPGLGLRPCDRVIVQVRGVARPRECAANTLQ